MAKRQTEQGKKSLGWIGLFYPPKSTILAHCVGAMVKFLKNKFLKVLEYVKLNSKQLLFYEIFRFEASLGL